VDANFLGKQVTPTLVLDELRPPHSVRFVMTGDPEAILSVRLAPDNTGQRTQVSLSLDVPSVPGFLLGAIMGGMLTSDVARLKQVLENV
jgi:hypothetical protein